jgi:alkylation response protein AidB-like acyl-CoA dehydrogenase
LRGRSTNDRDSALSLNNPAALRVSHEVTNISLIERLRPTIESCRDEADRLGRLPDQLVAELREAGAFRLNAPRELGGSELPLRTTLDLLENLGRIDGSTALTVWNLNMGLIASALPPGGVAKLGSDPLIANSTAPGTAVPDGPDYRLAGEWKIVSGAHAAEWFVLNSIVMHDGQSGMVDGQPELRFCCVPRSDVEIRDTWRVNGMRGTDSNCVVVDDVTVAADLTFPMTATSRLDRMPYRIGLFSLVVPGCAAVLAGMAQAAVDEMIALAPIKRDAHGAPLCGDVRIQEAIGRASAQILSARLGLLHTAGQLDQMAEARVPVTDMERAALRGAVVHVMETARTVLTAMYEAGSSSSLYADSRLATLFRDGHAAAQHKNMSTESYPIIGRILLGLPSGVPVVG